VSKSAEVNTPLVALVGVVGALVVFVLIVAAEVLFYHLEDIETYQKVTSQSPEEISNLVAQQQVQLNSYRWVDQKKGIVSIPIDRAMELVVRDLSKPTTTAAGGPPDGH
jgi:hypothetical protein